MARARAAMASGLATGRNPFSARSSAIVTQRLACAPLRQRQTRPQMDSVVESMFSQHRRTTRRVSRWRHGKQAERWSAAALMAAEFRMQDQTLRQLRQGLVADQPPLMAQRFRQPGRHRRGARAHLAGTGLHQQAAHGAHAAQACRQLRREAQARHDQQRLTAPLQPGCRPGVLALQVSPQRGQPGRRVGDATRPQPPP